MAVLPVHRLANQPAPPELLHSQRIPLCLCVFGVEFFLGVAVTHGGNDDLGNGDAFRLATDPPYVDAGRVVAVDVVDHELADRHRVIGVGKITHVLGGIDDKRWSLS